ncbi:MAG: hypothetical protein ACYTF6_14435 [Planctomycetota bacterium]|jgi:hypothetical protein
MPLWVWIVLGIAAYWAAYNCVWYLIQAVRPLEYRNLKISDLADHFGELLRRGGGGAQMIVTDESSGKSIRLRKYFRWGKPKINLDLIADEISRGQSGGREQVRIMRQAGFKCRLGIKGCRHFRDKLTCGCSDDVETAVRAAETVFFDLYGLPRESSLKVNVKGFISGYEQNISGIGTFFGSLRAIGHYARPYKQWQRRGGFFYWLGSLVGAVAREIRNAFFPRRPEDDLRR